jgi:phosphatidylserine synthase
MTLRYLAPNLVTSLAMLLGMLAVVLAMEGAYTAAAWLVVWSTFLDRADGVVARALRATSEFGVQMDSFADFFNFGAVPAFIIYRALGAAPGLPFGAGVGRALVLAACALWVLAASYRLARFNSIADDPRYKGLFFGIPTTLAAGTLMTGFLAMVQYSGPGAEVAAAAAGPRLLGALSIPTSGWWVFLGWMLALALLKVSNMRVRKPIPGRSLSGVVIGVFGVVGLVGSALRVLPELLVAIPSTFIVFWLLRQHRPELRAIPAPPMIPVTRASSGS